MASTATRRPLPALIALLALLLLTALVWWRVSNRDTGSSAAAKPCPTATASASAPSTLPPPAQVTVLVLNATTRTGIAGKARTALEKLGFPVPQAAQNDESSYRSKVTGTAQIRYGTAGAQGARLLSFYLPGAQLVPVTTSSATVTVSLGPKYTTVASQASVNTALAAAKLSISTATPSPSPAPTGSAASPSCVPAAAATSSTASGSASSSASSTTAGSH